MSDYDFDSIAVPTKKKHRKGDLIVVAAYEINLKSASIGIYNFTQKFFETIDLVGPGRWGTFEHYWESVDHLKKNAQVLEEFVIK